MIYRGEIYWVNLDPTIGSEIRKTRPALIVSNNTSNEISDTITVIPLTSQTKVIRHFEALLPTHVGGLKTASKAKANQIRTIDKARISGEPLGPPVPDDIMDQVSQAIKIHLEL